VIWEENGERLYVMEPLPTGSWREKCLRFLRFLLGIGKRYSAKEAEQMTVTVLIPAYNEVKSIGDTIRSIRRQTRRVDRILVVDDCSTDRTGDLARCHGVSVVRTPENTGTKAQAQNYALPFVDTTAVVTIDADTTLASDAVEKILPPLRNMSVASACGFVIPQRIRTVWERARYIQYLFGISIAKEAQSSIGTPLVSSGCFSAYRMALLREFGGFPDRSMVEDMDLTWTQLEQGYEVVLVSAARCYPIDPHNYQTYRDQVERWLRGFLQVISLHKTDIFKRKGLAFYVGWALLEMLVYPLGLLLLPLTLFHPKTAKFTWLSLLISLGIISVAAVWEAAKERRAWLAIQCLPAYVLIWPVNAYLIWKSFVLEWILRKRLSMWNKGH